MGGVNFLYLPDLAKCFYNCNTMVATFLYDFLYVNVKTEQNVVTFQHGA